MGNPATLVLALAALLFQPQPDQKPAGAAPGAPAANGLTCSVESVTVSSRAVPGGGAPARCEVSANVRVGIPEDAVGAAQNLVITEALDENGRDILVKREPDGDRADEDRRVLCSQLRGGVRYQHSTSNYDARGPARAQLAEIPPTISSLRGEVDAIVARRIVRRKIELKPMEEPLEVVPGLTFRLTGVETRGNLTRISFEIRTERRRDKAEGEPGLEPVFGGLIGLGPSGAIAELADGGSDWSDTDTPDEHITTAKNVPVFASNVAGWEVCGIDKIEKVRLTFRATRLKVAEEGR